MTNWFAPAIAFSALGFFWLTGSLQETDTIQEQERPPEIVMSGSTQMLLYGGDRFLAANIESIRAAAAVTTSGSQDFRLRAHAAVSQLNPCHEDNYWIGNASLSWGGAEVQGFELLSRAMRCRYWDEWPAFFYGFNQHFFQHDVNEARRALELAAQRSSQNAAAFRNFSIMLAAGEIDDTRMALEMLQNERDKAKDPKLREMLDKRVKRLSGLLVLRDAQTAFEKRYGRPPNEPQELLDSGLLKGFPDDPLRLGYEFRDNTFHLRQMTVQ